MGKEQMEELLVRIKYPVKAGSYDFGVTLNHTVVWFISKKGGTVYYNTCKWHSG